MKAVVASRTERVRELFARTFPAVEKQENPVGLVRVVVVAGQIALLFAVMHLFRLEEDFGFLRLTPLILGGFILHSVLPARLRLAFFVALSAAGIITVLGPVQGTGLMVVGLGLIGICHLPLHFGLRVGLLVLSGVTLAAIRVGWVETFWDSLPVLVLPLLGAMFMFRLAIYMYDLRHEKKAPSVWMRLSYFFMLPNVCFPLYPVIDYQTFQRTYFNDASHAVYQKGVAWICRGILHLLAYRLIYYSILPSPESLSGLGGVVFFMVTTYLLYLRISGQFHLIIGILCLFGFNLPETHHLYFLASSFSDYWRRINIYWKDFMMKLFYYPSFMKLRKLGMSTALVLSTLIVFAGTWLLHSYQWMWLRGSFPIVATDGLFWGILGLLVVGNTLLELKRGKKATLKTKGWSLSGAVRHSAKVVATLATITFLWSLWSSADIAEFLSLLRLAGTSGLQAWAGFAIGVLLLIGLGVGIQYLSSKGWRLPAVDGAGSFARSATYVCITAGTVWLIGQPMIRSQLGPGEALVASLRQTGPNAHDRIAADRGYYEGLLDSRQTIFALWQGQSRPKDWLSTRASGAYQTTGDMLDYEVRPSTTVTVKRLPLTTNQWGMRDREYTRKPSQGAVRIAQLGSSYAFGAGVAEGETFENVVETRLNREDAPLLGRRFEILNFAVDGYSVANNLAALRSKVLDFEPQYLLFVLHTTEPSRLNTHLNQVVTGEIQRTDPFIMDIIARSGATSEMERSEVNRRLAPYIDDVFSWALSSMAELAHEHGIHPIAAFIPITQELKGMDPNKLEPLIAMAAQAGFDVMNLEGLYGDFGNEVVQLAAWDGHPSVVGHQLIANRLYEELRPLIVEMPAATN